MLNEENALHIVETLRHVIREYEDRGCSPEDGICAVATLLIALCYDCYEDAEKVVEQVVEKMQHAIKEFVQEFPQSDSLDENNLGQWHRCKGCGKRCAMLKDGRIAHERTPSLLGIKSPVPCSVFNECHSAEFFWERMAGDAVKQPISIEIINEYKSPSSRKES